MLGKLVGRRKGGFQPLGVCGRLESAVPWGGMGGLTSEPCTLPAVTEKRRGMAFQVAYGVLGWGLCFILRFLVVPI